VGGTRHDLDAGELEAYRSNGFLLRPGVFSEQEVALLRREADAEFETDTERRTVEEGSGVVRAVHGSHLHREFFTRLTRLPRLIDVARQLLEDEVYVHQFKINAKRAFKGEVWEWHQDFIFWHCEDGLPGPQILTAAIFLDEVTEFNGPMIFVPGGQVEGVIGVDPRGEGMKSLLGTDLKYSLDQPTMRSLVARYGLAAPKGGPGSVLWFHSNVPHGSAPNMSPFDRGLVLVSYNAASNALPRLSSRPEWLAARDMTSLTAGERGWPTA
jgi:ectoine hydroxylase